MLATPSFEAGHSSFPIKSPPEEDYFKDSVHSCLIMDVGRAYPTRDHQTTAKRV